jgi:SAM-dependent methyltransferase
MRAAAAWCTLGPGEHRLEGGMTGRRDPASDGRWEKVAAQDAPSWYLDPLVARQKRDLHLELIERWTAGCHPSRVLKTDVFEDAFGEDHILADLLPGARIRIGMDVAPTTVEHARSRCAAASACFFAGDVRRLPLRAESIDVIVSNSTLDHFDSAADFRLALQELARVLRPGGRLLVTMDNLLNPFYLVLRWASRLRGAPFHLGYTTSQAGLVKALEDAGLEVVDRGTLIHNPRGLSTVLVLALRRMLGPRADGPIRTLLRLFARLERLPTRGFTACFVGACARKPARESHPSRGL